MINLTPAFRQKLFNDERNYLEYADITLADSTELHLTNADIWQNGFTIEDSVGDDNTFSALGSAIINSFTLVINNIYETYSEYDFTNARVVVAVGMELPNPNDSTTTYIEKAWKGEFGVDEATYNGSIITLKCLDDMVQFDRPYSESALVYPATLGEIVRDACAVCLGSASDLGTQQFPHYDYSIPNRPDDEKLTFREVISWCAAIAGCFARFAYYPTARASKLELKWFNQSVFEQRKQGTDGGVFDTESTSRYTTGDTLDGGTFNPWNTGDVADAGSFQDERPFHHITSLYQHNISVDDVVITGVRTTVKDDDEDSTTETITELTGTEGYVIDIANNEFITKTNATEIRTWLGQQLIGLTFRKATVTHPSDPSIEAGDIAFVYDRKGIEYPILVTRTVFQAFSAQNTSSGASTPNRNSATRYSQITKAYVENRKMVKHSQNPYAKALQDLANAVNSATGMYETDVTESGATIHYRHNKPNLEQSDIVIKESSVGITFTTNYLEPNPVWYGFTVDGDVVAKLISALGVNFEWAVGTTLTLGGANNGNGRIRVYDSEGNEIGRWDKDGIFGSGNFEMLSHGIRARIGMVENLYGFLIEKTNGDYPVISIRPSGNSSADIPIYSQSYSTSASVIERTLALFHVKNYSGTSDPNQLSLSMLNNGIGVYFNVGSGSTSDGACLEATHSRFLWSGSGVGYPSVNNYPMIYVTKSTSGSNIVKIAPAANVGIDISYSSSTNSWERLNGKQVEFASSSSKRYKHAITDKLNDELNPHKLYELTVKQFVYNEDHLALQYADMKDKTLIGFVAEDVEEIYPNAVIHNAEGRVESWDERRLLPPMLALIQEQKKQIDEQQQKIESLEDRIEKLEKIIMGLSER